jgi:haloalkane dehalogenase
VDVFRTPDERFADLPGYDYEPQYEQIEGLRLHRVDVGEGRPLVCFHGQPSWGYLYRKMLRPLREAGYRVICPDLAGFGRSDKPTDIGWYSYDRHTELTAEHLDRLDLWDAVVVVHDWGGPIGLRWAAANPDRVGALVILNTGLFTGRVSKALMAWREFVEKHPDLDVGRVIQAATTTEPPDDVVAAYDAPFPSAEAKAGPASFPLLIPRSDEEDGAAEMRTVADQLSRWQKPALVAFSDSDPFSPYPRAGERFVDLIPTVDQQVKIEGAGHFLQEDAGERIATEVLAFLKAS